MADEEHLKILEQGVGAWNRWRKENPKVRPDLHRAKLVSANLRAVYGRPLAQWRDRRIVKLGREDVTESLVGGLVRSEHEEGAVPVRLRPPVKSRSRSF